MAFFCLILVTVFLQPPWAVAPTIGNTSPGQRFYGNIPVNSAPFVGFMNTHGGNNVGIDFTGAGMRLYDPTTGATVPSSQAGLTFGPSQGQIYVPPKGQIHVPPHGQIYVPPQGQIYVPPKGQIHVPPHGQTYVPPQGQIYVPPQGQIHVPPQGQLYGHAHGAAGDFEDPEEEGHEEPIDEDTEYAEAEEELERAEAQVAKMTAKCNQRSVQNNPRLKAKCSREKDKAIAEMNEAKANLEAIKERMKSAKTSNSENQSEGSALQNLHNVQDELNGGNIGSPSTLNGQNSYASNIINNNVITNGGPYYTVRLTNMMNGATCEEKINIFRADGSEIEEFIFPCSGSSIESLNDGEEVLIGEPEDKFCAFTMTKIPDSLIVIEDGKCKKRTYSDSTVLLSTFKYTDCKDVKDRIKKIEENLKLRLFITRNGITRINADINSLEDELAKKLNQITPVSTITYKKTPSGSDSSTKEGQGASSFNDNDSETTPNSGSALQNLHNVHDELNGGNIGSPSTLNGQNSYASNVNDNNVITNDGPYYTVRLTNTMNGATCEEEKINIFRADGSEIEEFKFPCSGSIIESLNDGEEVLIGEPEDKFCAFTMTKIPDSLIVIEDRKCKKITYSDSTVLLSTFKDSDCEYIKDRIKKIEEKLKLRLSINPNGITRINADINSLEDELAKKLNQITPVSTTTYKKTPSGSDSSTKAQKRDEFGEEGHSDAKGATEEEEKSVEEPAETEIYNGPYYAVKLTNKETRNGDQCDKKMSLIRQVDNGLIEEFTYPCTSQVLSCSDEDQEAMVGRPDDNFCAFATKKMPKILLVIKDGKCQKRTYSDNTSGGHAVSVLSFNDNECENIKNTLRKLDDQMVLGVMTGRDAYTNPEIEALDDELVRQVSGSPVIFKNPATQTTPGKPAATGLGLQDLHNAHVNLYGDTFNSGVGSSTNSYSQMDSSNGNRYKTDIFNGPYYSVKLTDEMRYGDQCDKKLAVIKNGNNELIEEFSYPCSSQAVSPNVEREAMIGHPDDKFCAFATKKMPKSLLLIKDGKCRNKMYYESTSGDVEFSVLTFKDDECENIKGTLRQINDKFSELMTNIQNSERINAEIQDLVDQLFNKVNRIPVDFKKPATQTTPDKKPATASALQNANNNNQYQKNGVTNSFNNNNGATSHEKPVTASALQNTNNNEGQKNGVTNSFNNNNGATSHEKPATVSALQNTNNNQGQKNGVTNSFNNNNGATSPVTSGNNNPKPPVPSTSGKTSPSFLERIVNMIPAPFRSWNVPYWT